MSFLQVLVLHLFKQALSWFLLLDKLVLLSFLLTIEKQRWPWVFFHCSGQIWRPVRLFRRVSFIQSWHLVTKIYQECWSVHSVHDLRRHVTQSTILDFFIRRFAWVVNCVKGFGVRDESWCVVLDIRWEVKVFFPRKKTLHLALFCWTIKLLFLYVIVISFEGLNLLLEWDLV